MQLGSSSALTFSLLNIAKQRQTLLTCLHLSHECQVRAGAELRRFEPDERTRRLTDS